MSKCREPTWKGLWTVPPPQPLRLCRYLPQRLLVPTQFEKVENKPVVVGYIAGAAAAIIIAEWLIHLPALDIVSLSAHPTLTEAKKGLERDIDVM